MKITRRRLLKTTGAAGALALATSANAQALRRGGAAGSSASRPGAIASRTLTWRSGSKEVAAGSPFRFGLVLKKRDLPSGASVSLTDGAGNVLSAQVDAIDYWPDGSVRRCEVRGYTARAIAARGRDTISITRDR